MRAVMLLVSLVLAGCQDHYEEAPARALTQTCVQKAVMRATPDPDRPVYTF